MIKEIESLREALKPRTDHNNRLKEMPTWISDGYPDYFTTGTVDLSEDQHKDNTLC